MRACYVTLHYSIPLRLNTCWPAISSRVTILDSSSHDAQYTIRSTGGCIFVSLRGLSTSVFNLNSLGCVTPLAGQSPSLNIYYTLFYLAFQVNNSGVELTATRTNKSLNTTTFISTVCPHCFSFCVLYNSSTLATSKPLILRFVVTNYFSRYITSTVCS